MTKSELVQRLLAEHPELHHLEIEKAVNVVFEEITEALTEGSRVELRGFGAFSVRERNARKGRNPCTGSTVNVPAKKVPFFKCGKQLRERANS